jgi:hypothetical protein
MSFDSDLWRKIIAHQNRIFKEAVSTQMSLVNEAIKQFGENNAKMLNEAVKKQKESFDEMIQQQGEVFPTL